jgi:integrase
LATVVELRSDSGTAVTVQSAADAFLDSISTPNTLRSYTTAVTKTAEQVGVVRPLAAVADEIGGALELLWGESAVNTWNARRAGVLSWLGWCREQGQTAPAVPAWVKRMTPPDSDTPVRSRTAIDRLISRRGVHVREKTLWRMLYETCARAEELLGVNIEDLDLAGRCCPVKPKGARPKRRRRGGREDYVLEPVCWDAGTARLLPRLIKNRTHGPLFTTHRKPGPGKVLTPRDVCPDTQLARLSYGQARAVLDAATCIGQEIGTGWDLHEYRHSGLTHLGEQGASLLELMAKSRHKKPENVKRYFKPSPQAMRELTSLLAPGADRR